LAAPAFPKIEQDAQKLTTESVTCPASEAANKKKVAEELTNSVKAIEGLETELQQELKDQTGTTASAAAVSAAAAAVSTVSSAGRRNLNKMFLNFA